MSHGIEYETVTRMVRTRIENASCTTAAITFLTKALLTAFLAHPSSTLFPDARDAGEWQNPEPPEAEAFAYGGTASRYRPVPWLLG